MRNSYDNDDFLAKCRNIDFSADSQKYEENLDALKGKLTQANEGRHIMKKRKKLPIAIAAVLVAIMIPVAALAAAPAIREHLTITIIRSDGDGVAIAFDANDLDIEHLGDGSVVIQFSTEIDSAMFSEMDDEEIIVRITEGAQIIQMELQHFYDLDKALSHFAAENPLLPSYLPEGFAFVRATFPVGSPWDLEDELSRRLNIYYGDGQNELRLTMFYTLGGPEYTEFQWVEPDADTIAAAGMTNHFENVTVGVALEVDNIMYVFNSAHLTPEQLLRISESLQ